MMNIEVQLPVVCLRNAVVGGLSYYQPRLFGIAHLEELPLGQSGSERANALAAVDRRYYSNTLIVADLSNDASYVEDLFNIFGCRVVGVHITRHGNGMEFERRQVPGGVVWIYSIGRTTLIEKYLAEMERGDMRIVNNEMSRRAYQQLAELEVVDKEIGRFYNCVSGRHDDLGISCAMLAWATRHPHLSEWVRIAEQSQIVRKPRPPVSSAAWTLCGVKRLQTIHHCSVDVAHGLVLLPLQNLASWRLLLQPHANAATRIAI